MKTAPLLSVSNRGEARSSGPLKEVVPHAHVSWRGPLSPTQEHVTELLVQASGGNRAALDALMPLVYEELRGIARRQRRLEPEHQTLATTALVHEAYLKLVDQSRVSWQNRAHFFAVAARSIRRILIDRARSRLAKKRGGGWERIALDELANDAKMDDGRAQAFLDLEDALVALEALDPRQAKVVVYRFYGGLTIEETGDVLSISPATVKREWTMAKAWLHRELASERPSTKSI